MRIIHVITDLNPGGAEIMLYNLLAGCDCGRFEPEVVSMTDIGPVGEKIRGLGIPVKALGMRSGMPSLSGLRAFARMLRNNPPALVQGWMCHANLVASLGVIMSRANIPVVWGIHHIELIAPMRKATATWSCGICSFLTRTRRAPARVICCSRSAMEAHLRMKYKPELMTVVYNGFDLDRFKPDANARGEVRAELGIGADAFVAGFVARFDPHKDHRNFIAMAAVVAKKYPDARFVLCGLGIEWENAELAGWIDEAGLRDRFRLLGPRDDIPRIQAAMYAVVSSSCAEAFPLTIGEAMACGTPCVVTDVGDSAMLVGDTGFVAPPRDPGALADALIKMIELGAAGRGAMGASARGRIEENFSLPAVVGQFEKIYSEYSK